MDFSEARDTLWLATLLYGAGVVAGISLASRGNKLVSRLLPLFLILGGFIAQTQGLAIRGQLVKGCPLGNGMERIQFMLWSVVLGYLIMRLLLRLNLLGSFCAGLASLGGILSLLSHDLDTPYWLEKDYQRLFSGPWIELHASVAIFSYGLFALLAVVSSMYLVQQNALHSKRPSKLGPYLPSMNKLEVGGERLLLVGVIFLTVSIAVGTLHWGQSPENLSSVKLGVTLALWIAYCGLWYLHFRQKLYGKKFAKGCILLFAIAVLSLGFVRSAGDRINPSPESSAEDAP